MNNNMTQNKTNATDESFWSMLSKAGSEFSIYIPRIQRDYAQGRTDDATTQIRDKFVDDIFDSVINHADDGQTLDVNFIYGNIEDDDGKRRFVPIDGQQRLTTLFLLHWYFAVYSGEIDSDPEVKRRLLQFQYETRNVTGKFCRNLTEYVRIDFRTLGTGKKVSDAIRNYYWFFSDFEHDSSVRAMLVMIDAIHEKAMEYLADGVSLDGIFDVLISEKAPIRFLYLNIDDVGLTDSIYIKMNARGKALTHFENFKAQLRNYLSEDENFASKFINNINGKWSQFFWAPVYRKTVKDAATGKEILETSFDSQMMKFFRFGMLMDYIIKVDNTLVVNSQKNIRDSLRDLLKEQDYFFTSRLFKDGFRHVYEIDSASAVLNVDTFRKINVLLNVLSKRQELTDSISFVSGDEFNKTYIGETRAFRRLIGASDERALTNEEQIVLYAEYAFLIRYSNEDYTFVKETELNRWLRLVSNLVKPTLNLQLDIFFYMIRSINRLVEAGSAMSCDEYMSRLLRRNYRQSAMSVFTETQVVEESMKSILMQLDPEWKKAIADSENTFMDGQTSMLFSFSGLTEEYERQIAEYEEQDKDAVVLPEDAQILSGVNSESGYYASFMNYLGKFTMLFDTDGVRSEIEDKALFRRALLCYGGKYSYMLPPGKARQSFLNNTDRDYGFKRLLRDDNTGKRDYLKMLMDDIVVDRPVTEQLQEIIDRKTFDEDDRWKQYFVKLPEILDCVYTNDASKKDPQNEWVFMSTQKFIRRNNSDDILLLTRTQTNSINRELYSYVLFLMARKEGLKVKYHAEYTDGAEKYAYYDNKQGERILVVYKKKENVGYVFIAKKTDNAEMFYHDTLEGMLDYVEKTIKKDDTDGQV
jgi:hypothetical protein